MGGWGCPEICNSRKSRSLLSWRDKGEGSVTGVRRLEFLTDTGTTSDKSWQQVQSLPLLSSSSCCPGLSLCGWTQGQLISHSLNTHNLWDVQPRRERMKNGSWDSHCYALIAICRKGPSICIHNVQNSLYVLCLGRLGLSPVLFVNFWSRFLGPWLCLYSEPSVGHDSFQADLGQLWFLQPSRFPWRPAWFLHYCLYHGCTFEEANHALLTLSLV